MAIKRRTFVKQLVAGASFSILPVTSICARPRFDGNPFSLGIASGDPTDQSVILWTRVAPEPLAPDGGMRGDAVPVRWWIAKDPGFRRNLQHGTALATPDLAHSVHIDVQGLEPETEYWYRFAVGDIESRAGRTCTLPSATSAAQRVRFVTCSCQHFEQGYFTAFRHLIDEAPDFVVHLGDYIYDVSFGPSVREHTNNAPLTTLTDFRRRHALYKSDHHLQEAHRLLPFFVVPDNHDALIYNDVKRLAVRAAAYQAWYEHLPVRALLRPGSAALSIYQSIDFGGLLRINLLDTRQYRDNQNIGEADLAYGFGNYRRDVADRRAVTRSMLGIEQTQWLSRQLTSSMRWNVVASTVPFGEFVFHRAGELAPYYYIGSWDGYPANRRNVISALQRARNPVVLSGDIHSFWAKHVTARIDSKTRIIAPEFVTSSISSELPNSLSRPIVDNLAANPSVMHYEPNYRGYCLHDVTPDQWQTRMRGLDTVRTEKSRVHDVAGFRIGAGDSSMQRI